jgi:iron complex transport system permease protein
MVLRRFGSAHHGTIGPLPMTPRWRRSHRIPIPYIMGLFLGLIALFILAIGLSLSVGSVAIPLDHVFAILTGQVANQGVNQATNQATNQAAWTTILLQFRLPKTIAAILAGVALSSSGLQMQTLFRNPLAGPYLLGISSGASLGVALVVLLQGSLAGGWLGSIGLIGASFAGSALALLVMMVAARYARNSVTLLILGLLFGYGTNAIIDLLMHFSQPEKLQSYIRWTLGSFGGVTWSQVPIFAGAVGLGWLLTLALAKPLNLLLLDEAQAIGLGLSIVQLRCWSVISVSLLAGSVTAFCGPIAFLGVAVPHLARALVSSRDHRLLLPIVGLIGGILALVADLLTQLPGRQVLPLNSVMALIGTPVVFWVILRRQIR